MDGITGADGLAAADHKEAVLPYRCEAEDLVRLLDARARGWALPQIRSLNFSAKNFEGTLLTAHSLGFVEGDAGDLSEKGRTFALAAPEARPALLLEAMERFEPYGLLLEAIFSGENPAATPVEWVERWWSTHGYGSSQSNRSEAATVFGRLVDFVGLASYLQGRRGHPSRIEWRRAPGELRRARRNDVPSPAVRHPPATPPRPTQVSPPEPASQGEAPLPPPPGARDAYSNVNLELRPGRMVQIRVPATLTRREKERLMSLLELLITTVPQE